MSVVLRPKKSSALWLLVGCTMFVAGGLWMAQEAGWIGYLCAGFFALGIPVAVVQMLPGSSYLRITPRGLSVATMYRVTEIPWDVVDHFFVVKIRQAGTTARTLVGFNYVATYDQGRLGRRFSAVLAKCEGALPDTYGENPEELAAMLNRYLREFSPHEPRE